VRSPGKSSAVTSPVVRLVAALAVLALGTATAAGDAMKASGAVDEPSGDGRAPIALDDSSGKRVYSVAAIGDSLTDFKSQGGKYLRYLQERCPASRFDSWGKGGNMVNQMRKRFARDVLGEGSDVEKPKYTHVIVLGGIADIGSNETAGRTVSKIEDDLERMYEMAHDHGITVIALTLPPWGGFKEYNEERHEMTMELNAWIRGLPKDVDRAVDIYPLLSCGNPRELCKDYAWPDKLHWSKKGHEIVGAELYERVFSDCE
jgi:lysophospholipase L1-like esterase